MDGFVAAVPFKTEIVANEQAHRLPLIDGGTLPLMDYASAAHDESGRPYARVWIPTVPFWEDDGVFEVSIDQSVAIVPANQEGALIWENGKLRLRPANSENTRCWQIEPVGDGSFRLKTEGGYLSNPAPCYEKEFELKLAEYEENGNQLWLANRTDKGFRLVNKRDGIFLTLNNPDDVACFYNNWGSQFWYFRE